MMGERRKSSVEGVLVNVFSEFGNCDDVCCFPDCGDVVDTE